ncbi:CoA-binding protein [Oscillatoriales cyanobacterium LEGE 11467]|uniref:CoA-binding protein n=1 Tax=Zarconia navalis LEGE 11467 TaxID=1828826 RepID=A0A928VWV6_9CYAN|nr:CoA-binding protein [Zarconia navalis]MBE9039275.1 CoA-binding protein [Zarconia navalis LEGE 11467]
MSFTPKTTVLVQGIAEPLGSTHAALMKDYGTRVVAGVSPGLGGQTLHDIPVFDLVEQARHQVGTIDIATICVHPYQALDAALEAIAAGIRQLIILTEGMPPLDMVRLLRKAEYTETLVVGPSCPGIIVPGKILLGTHPAEFYTPGSVGLLGRSGTLTYEIALTLTKAGLGQSIGVGIGSDAIVGSSFLQWLQILDEDENTDAIVLVGETGGEGEEAAADYIREAIDTPVVVYVAGRYAPKHRLFGHTEILLASRPNGRSTGSATTTSTGTAQRKVEAFIQAKIPVADRPSEIPRLIKKALGKR